MGIRVRLSSTSRFGVSGFGILGCRPFLSHKSLIAAKRSFSLADFLSPPAVFPVVPLECRCRGRVKVRTAPAKDSYGASSSCTATVKVVDTTPPSLTCPSNQTVNATGPTVVVTNYPATASDACGAPLVTYNIAGTPITRPYNFPIGDTAVNVTAKDAATNVTTCSFNVHVNGAAEQITNLIAKVQGLPGVKSPNKTALVSPLQTALAALAANKKSNGCSAMQAFINLVNAQKDKKLISEAAVADLITDATRIRTVLGCP